MMMQALKAAAQQQGGAAIDFDIENDITWHSLFWAEGTAMTALAYGDTDAVTTWPNETSETDLTTSSLPYKASNPDLNGKPSVEMVSGNGVRLVGTWGTAPSNSAPVSMVIVVSNNTTDQNSRSLAHIGDAKFEARGDSGGSICVKAGGVRMLKINSVNNDTDGHLMVGVIFDDPTSALYVDGGTATNKDLGYTAFTGSTMGLGSANGGYRMRSDVALFGVYEGDITADPAWSAMESWVSYYYGVAI